MTHVRKIQRHDFWNILWLILRKFKEGISVMLFWLISEKSNRKDFFNAVLFHVRRIIKQDLCAALWLMAEKSWSRIYLMLSDSSQRNPKAGFLVFFFCGYDWNLIIGYVYYLNPSGYIGFSCRFRVVSCCFRSDPFVSNGFSILGRSGNSLVLGTGKSRAEYWFHLPSVFPREN
jgi:hypothetical protein